MGQKQKGINPEFIHPPLSPEALNYYFALAGLLTRSVFDVFPS
jgi:hypothetical protein